MEECNLFLDREVYYPGETITGRVVCFFGSPKRVRGIYVNFTGCATTCWTEDGCIFSGKEEYFNSQVNLVQGGSNGTLISPGCHTYPFSFRLLQNSPSTTKRKYGSVTYRAKAVVDLPWKLDLTDKSRFTVGSYLDLNRFDSVKKSIAKTEKKLVLCVLSGARPVTFSVQMPVSGYVPCQTIHFKAEVKNMSKVNIPAVCFQLVQVYEFRSHTSTKQREELVLAKFTVADGAVPGKTERSWNLQLKIPPETGVPNLAHCNIIKMFCELRGTVLLPFPHFYLNLKVPVSLGTVPLRGSTQSTSRPMQNQNSEG